MKALLLVDIQKDFCPGGALPVPEGDRVVAVANELQRHVDLVVATRDWHPADHCSFAANHPGRAVGDVVEVEGLSQFLWPVHCVRDSDGAEFAPGLAVDGVDHVVDKGTSSAIDSFSGFYDNGHRESTGLADYLREHGVTEVLICGLATDYCVKFTALDAVAEGFATTVVVDGCRGVNVRPGDVDRALADVEAAGCRLVGSEQVD